MLRLSFHLKAVSRPICRLGYRSLSASSDATRNFDVVDYTKPYPRDFVGYGPRTPDPQWPNNALLAVSFVNNFEEGAEKNPLNGDPVSEELGQEMALWGQYQGERNPSAESMMEYGPRAAIWRMMRGFDDRGLKLTTWGVGLAYARNPEVVKFLHAQGHELASHGYRWYDYYGIPEDKERQHMEQIIKIQQDLTGTRPRGIGIVRRSNNTFRLSMEEYGFDYFSDQYNDDLPYYDRTLGKPHLVIPYNLNLNDANFWTNRYAVGRHFYENCKDAIDMLLEEGKKGQPKFVTIALHNRTVSVPNRQLWLNKLLDDCAENPRIWVATRSQIADHWREVHPAEE